jgi:hypothetical protein
MLLTMSTRSRYFAAGLSVATLLCVSLLHEHLGVGGYTAFALILLGSWLATRGSAVNIP